MSIGRPCASPTTQPPIPSIRANLELPTNIVHAPNHTRRSALETRSGSTVEVVSLPRVCEHISGYEQLSTVAEEVENPRRNYPLALALVVPMSMATYFLPTFASLAALNNWQDWHAGYFSTAASLIGGPWLGGWMTMAAMLANVALLNSTVLASTAVAVSMRIV